MVLYYLALISFVCFLASAELQVKIFANTVETNGHVELTVKLDCGGQDKLVQLVAIVKGTDLHGHFSKVATCSGLTSVWKVQAPRVQGEFNVSVATLFENFTHEALSMDLNHYTNKHDWAAFVARERIVFSKEILLQAPLHVVAIPKHRQFQQASRYWNLTDLTFGEAGHKMLSRVEDVSVGDIFFFGDSILDRIFPELCDFGGFPLNYSGMQSQCCGELNCMNRCKWWDDHKARNLEDSHIFNHHNCSTPSKHASIYISFGSHSPGVGFSDLQLARYHNFIRSAVSSPNRQVFVAATTAINEEMMPKTYSEQFFLRSNLRIKYQNKMAQIACKQAGKSCTFIDLFTPTFALRDVPGAFLPGDPVHFRMGKATIANIVFRHLQRNIGNNDA